MISVLLLYKILQLAVVMGFGFVFVKLNIIKSQDSTVLSKISLYLLMPVAIINSFDVEMTADIVNGLVLAFVFAIVIHIILLIIDAICKKLLNASIVERASIVYSNAANLIIPIVSYILGEEWVIYSCAFMSVQLVFLWTHGIRLFSSEQKMDIKKILLNINIIAIVIGVAIMALGVRLPGLIKDLSSSLTNMLGIVAMLIAGMLAADINFKKVFTNKRLHLVLIMRLVICPLIVLVVLKCALLNITVSNAKEILLISYLASITPSAATILQFAQIHNKDADFAVGINIATTLACIVTMPIFVALFQM